MTEQNLIGKEILLSGSVPNADRKIPNHNDGLKYIDLLSQIQAQAINDSIGGLTAAIINWNGRLVFGGHPAVTPLVAQYAAAALDASNDEKSDPLRRKYDSPPIMVFQAKAFLGELVEEAKELQKENYAEFSWHGPSLEEQPDERKARIEGVKELREAMITRKELIAMFVIGGMDGVQEEARLFSRQWNGSKPIYVLTETGAAAELIGRQPLSGKINVDQSYFERLLSHEVIRTIYGSESRWGALTDFLVERLTNGTWQEDI